MGEVSSEGGGGKHKGGKPKGKKSSTHIDMTPMVDLAFLLLTFFMLTTSFSKPKTMEIVMPDKPKPNDPNPPKINENDVVNVLLGPNNRLFYYIGTDPNVQSTTYGKDGIQKFLIDYKRQRPNVMVLIKPEETSKYKNVVDMFDIMNVTNMSRYALVDITPKEKDLINSK
jgi:biopolymer transport protein ExbD